ncbi:Uma2 family endonuclease [Nostoc sphaeroides CCNUC1]|uniref:Uma2 family endonuclease n=1 Tax=Nostoc sphaeroides CCNUC1 TaxID=2653204 RepID=A0A5P8VZQ3_9NOSO|nr:Uma2 family endonuclease [Nostoc sphaeroides CCNUC1]
MDGFYEETRFTGNTAIASTIFPEFQLTAEQVLNAGESNISNTQTTSVLVPDQGANS